MRKWDGKPTSSLEARVRELRGKAITKGDSVGENAAPAASSPDQADSLVLIPILWRGPPSHFCSRRAANFLTRIREALPPARWRKGTTVFTGWCGFGGLARQIHKRIKF